MPDAIRQRDGAGITLEDVRADLVEKLARWTGSQSDRAPAIPWLSMHRRPQTSEPMLCVYEPSLAVIVQGKKQVVVGDEVFVYDDSNFFLTSIDVPVTSHVVEASEERPYLSMRIDLDLATIRQMILDYDLQAPKVSPITRGMATGRVTDELLCALGRLLDLLDSPRDIPVLADLIHKEIAYHLLKSEQGGRLWQIAMTGSQSNRIQKVIDYLRRRFTEPLRIDELADLAAMSVSSMHHHFREITSMSPLQFQKQLRLYEARRLMLVDNLDAGMAALRVGYESSSQFSREYSRQFGQPPLRDIKQLRASAETPDGARSA